MDFEEWYQSPEDLDGFKDASREGWKACKQEILKIIQNNTTDKFVLFDLENIKKEIEKL